ncbi:MAG: TonB-dependent receptor [Gammaproteobacteria bacterium]|nr:TonB-dependent receptor [Gammaproteobacteria bacterium]
MFEPNRVSHANFLAVALLTLPLIGSLAYASEIEEVVVTARKITENKQDVPIAVTSLSAEDIEALNIQEMRSLFDHVPGAWSGGESGEKLAISLRGIISDGRNAADNPGVTVMQDGEVIARHFMASAPQFDLQRVEVLLGPQGTTYGRNSTAGTVNFISNGPTEEFSSSIKVDAGSHNLQQVEGFVSGTMGNNVRGRLSGYFSSRDGYVKHTLTGKPLDNADHKAIRAQIEWDASDDTTVHVTARYSDTRNDHFGIRKADTGDAWGYSNFFGWTFFRFQDNDDPWNSAPSSHIQDGTPMGWDLETMGISVEIEHSWDTVNLYSLSAFSRGEDMGVVDLATTPWDLANEVSNSDADTFSQEIRLDNAGSDAELGWMAGVYYATEDHDRSSITEAFYAGCDDMPDLCINPPPIFGGNIPLPTLDSSGTTDILLQNNETTSYAVFGELSYDISDKTNVIAGLRYSNDNRDHAGEHRATGGLFFIFAAAPVDLKNSGTWSDTSGRLAISHRFSDEVMVYGSYSTAFKGGGFNPEPENAAGVLKYDEEHVAAIEIGAKMDLLDNRLRLNITMFNMDYEDIQSQFLDERLGASSVGNIGEAYIRGIEVETIAQIGENFRLQGNFTSYDSEYEVWDPSSSTNANPDNIIGERLRGAYKNAFHLSGIYTVNLAQGGTLDFRADYRDRSTTNALYVNNLLDSAIPGVEFINASIRYTSADEKWNTTLWGRNLTEEAEVKFRLFHAGVWSARLRVYGAPRTFGLSFKYNFD